VAIDATNHEYFYAHYFDLNNIDSVTLTALGQLFDTVRVNEVTVSWIPNITTTYAAPTGHSVTGTVASVLDFDDVIVPTGVTAFNDRSTLKRWSFTKPMNRRFKPCTLGVASKAGDLTFAAASLMFKPTETGWVDLLFNNVAYMGSKWMIVVDVLPTAIMEIGTFQITALVHFAQPR